MRAFNCSYHQEKYWIKKIKHLLFKSRVSLTVFTSNGKNLKVVGGAIRPQTQIQLRTYGSDLIRDIFVYQASVSGYYCAVHAIDTAA